MLGYPHAPGRAHRAEDRRRGGTSYEGLYRREVGETREERDRVPTATWGNEFSFRHTEESLLRLIRDCGYGKVMAMRPPHSLDYTSYLCLPSPLDK